MSVINSVNNSIKNNYQQLSSGKKINKAADNAAGLAIAEKLLAQENGHETGAKNIQDASSLLKVSDGALSNIGDSLQRIRELAVQAGNGTMTASDREGIQWEIDQLKDSIKGISENTEFNTKKLLNGENDSLSIHTGNGTKEINTGNATLEALGIKDFDVTGKFNLKDIDKAISSVNKARSKAGGQMNALESAYNYNKNTSLNLAAANSRISDTDYGKTVSNLKKNEVLNQYAIFAQKAKLQQQANMTKILY